MTAIDTVLFDVHNATASPIGLTAATVANGDSATVRNYALTSLAKMEAISVKGTGTLQARVSSPMFHDDVTGLTFSFSEEPTAYLLPREVGQKLTPGDTLSVYLAAAATSDTVATLHHYYNDMPGVSARLHAWGDISGIIKNIKVVEVDVTSSATIGAWQDTAITTTENQLHAKSDYALIGYLTDTALVAVGIKGQATGNLRVCGPGPSATLDTSDYFVRLSDMQGTPHIPVFNADDRDSVYVSVATNTASQAAKISLILAELSTPLSS